MDSCKWHHDICLCGLQQALNVTDRVFSVSSDTVAPCGQLQVACTQIAPLAEMLNDTDYLDNELLPYVDGIITSTPNASISPLFAFSASTDPGLLFLQLVSCILHLASCILHLASCILHLASCILHLASCILHLASCIWQPALLCVTDHVSNIQ